MILHPALPAPSRHFLFIALGIALPYLGGCGSGEPSAARGPVAEHGQPIEDGYPTNWRPEVVQFSRSYPSYKLCTATLIRQNYALTAAHCIDFSRNFTGDGLLLVQSATGGHIGYFRVLQGRSFSDRYDETDVALLKVEPVPTTVTPAVLSTRDPVAGEWTTHMGVGCNDYADGGTGSHVKRYSQSAWPDITDSCPGDSGGPIFLGQLTQRGALARIASQGSQGRTVLDHLANPVIYKDRIETLIRQDNWFEVDFNRPGLDYNQHSAPSVFQCHTDCSRDPNCRAFSYVTANSSCWMKKGLAEGVPAPGVISGLPLPTGAFNLPGGDYFSSVAADAETCQARCGSDPSCKAFTFVGATKQCYMKNTTPAVNTTSCPSCVSGYHRGIEYDVDRPGGDYKNFTASSAGTCATQCAWEEACRAWSYSGTTCWLKQNAPAAMSRTGIQSGVRHGLEYNSNRPGSDYGSVMLPTPLPELCQAICFRETSCWAWAMDFSGRCWLKNAVPAQITGAASEGIVSGRYGMERF